MDSKHKALSLISSVTKFKLRERERRKEKRRGEERGGCGGGSIAISTTASHIWFLRLSEELCEDCDKGMEKILSHAPFLTPPIAASVI